MSRTKDRVAALERIIAEQAEKIADLERRLSTQESRPYPYYVPYPYPTIPPYPMHLPYIIGPNTSQPWPDGTIICGSSTRADPTTVIWNG
jgi:hypothetical protein